MKKFSLIALFLLLSSTFIHALTLTNIGSTYNMAQVTTWIDEDTFAVGRWDGSITIFRKQQSGEWGPVIKQALTTPSNKGVEMLIAFNKKFLLSSNGQDSVILFKRFKGRFYKIKALQYDNILGTANSALFIDKPYSKKIVIGHQNGFISVWEKPFTSFQYYSLDTKISDPIVSPYPLFNVRGLAYWRDNIVITGAEDGGISLIDIAAATIVHQELYNPVAQRGINDIEVFDNKLIVVNCAVGDTDYNFWLYDITYNDFIPASHINLKDDPLITQVYCFDVETWKDSDNVYAFATTGDGFLWVLKIENDVIQIIDKRKVDEQNIAASISVEHKTSSLISITHALKIFTIGDF